MKARMAALVAVAAWTTAAWGEEAGWKNSLNLGGSLTDGNSETRQINASLISEGEKADLGSVRAGLEANYGETTKDGVDDTTVDNGKAFANVKKTLSPVWFAYLDGVGLYDNVAEIDYRLTVGPGLGAYLLKNDATALSVEAGPSYVWEKVNDVKDDYFAVRFGQRLTQALGPSAKLWESVDYVPTADDFSDYLLISEVGVEAAMNSRLSLRVVLQDKYDSTPGEGLEKNDLTLIAGIGVKL